MAFSLEALQAEQGDCLLVHFGRGDKPRMILVNGGPGSMTYDGVLKPRLAEIGSVLGSPVELPLVVCSHIDDDHIGGVLELVLAASASQPPAAIDCLWHNRPLKILDESSEAKVATVLRVLPETERFATADMKWATDHNWEVDADYGFIVSSVHEGDELYAAAKQAGISINCGFGGLVMAPTPDKGYAEYQLSDLTLMVIGPDKARIDALRKLWKAETRGHELEGLAARSAGVAAAVAADDDVSVTNLSSIVFLANYGDHSILMTGDARGQYIIDGLDRAGLVQNGGAKVDILKLQHHGSSHNSSEQFFATVIADHYVISANGKYDNPDMPTFDALVAARGETGYSVWMTNGDSGTKLAPTVTAVKAKYAQMNIRVRPAAAKSITIDLEEPLSY